MDIGSLYGGLPLNCNHRVLQALSSPSPTSSWLCRAHSTWSLNTCKISQLRRTEVQNCSFWKQKQKIPLSFQIYPRCECKDSRGVFLSWKMILMILKCFSLYLKLNFLPTHFLPQQCKWYFKSSFSTSSTILWYPQDTDCNTPWRPDSQNSIVPNCMVSLCSYTYASVDLKNLFLGQRWSYAI